MTYEEVSAQPLALGKAMREQEVRIIMSLLGCSRERAEKLRVWLRDDEMVIGGLHGIDTAGQRLGRRLAEAAQSLLSLTNQVRNSPAHPEGHR